MEQQLRRYALGAAGAGFVLVWATLGPVVAFLALLGAVVALQMEHLSVPGRSRRRRRPSGRRANLRVRPLRDEAEDLPLVPDEPSLIIGNAGF